MDNRHPIISIAVIIFGILIAIIGFVFAFSEERVFDISSIKWITIRPYLISGIIIGIGGIVIAVIGNSYFKKNSKSQSIETVKDTMMYPQFCSKCGLRLTQDVAFCPQCGYKIK